MNAKIFINYRRDDSPWNSLALYQELIKHFPKENVFKDFNAIEPGQSFKEKIGQALEECDVLLVLISEKWLTVTDKNGKVRINKDDDLVRLEIATALKRKISVIPVLFDDASLPDESELPENLRELTYRQSIEIDKTRFEADTAKLVTAIQHVVDIDAGVKPLPGNERNSSTGKYLLIVAGIVVLLLLLKFVLPMMQSKSIKTDHSPGTDSGYYTKDTKADGSVKHADGSVKDQIQPAAPSSAHIFSSGQLRLACTLTYDLDKGAIITTLYDPDVDLFFDCTNGIRQIWAFSSSATFYVMGHMDFESLTEKDLIGLPYSNNKINAAEPNNHLTEGTVVGCHTSAGRYCKFIIKENKQNLEEIVINWVTYDATKAK